MLFVSDGGGGTAGTVFFVFVMPIWIGFSVLLSARPYQPGSPLPIRTARKAGSSRGSTAVGDHAGRPGAALFFLMLPFFLFAFSFFCFSSSLCLLLLFTFASRASHLSQGGPAARPGAALFSFILFSFSFLFFSFSFLFSFFSFLSLCPFFDAGGGSTERSAFRATGCRLGPSRAF